MNKNQKSIGGKVLGKLKRGMALTMATVLLITSPLPGLSFPSFADPNLTKEELPNKGGGDTTAFYYQQAGVSFRPAFDIQGIQDLGVVGTANPWKLKSTEAITVTSPEIIGGIGGFPGFKIKIKPKIDAGGKGEYPFYGKINGDVYNLDEVYGVQMQVKIYPSADKSAVLVDYIVHNNLSYANSIQVCTYANISLGGHSNMAGYDPSVDPADTSTLVANDNGFYMMNTATRQTLEILTNDKKLGCTQTDTKWVGLSTKMSVNHFTNGPFSISNTDSALSYSFKYDLNPNQTIMKRVAFKVNNTSYYVSAHGSDSATGGGVRILLQQREGRFKRLRTTHLTRRRQESYIFKAICPSRIRFVFQTVMTLPLPVRIMTKWEIQLRMSIPLPGLLLIKAI